ncbi:MAG: TerC family protein [Clostridiales bacterium]|nr:TerC family protein [Clostridiales bacterium]
MSQFFSYIASLFSEYTVGSFISAVFSIALIDLVLSGDNAAVIGLAIRRLPAEKRGKAAAWGAFAAIALRIIFTLFAVRLLTVPYLALAGGALLLFITYKLLKAEDGKKEHTVKSPPSMAGAIGVIVAADLFMAFDNVLAVAGAAHGSQLLVIFGLLLSIPLLVWGATWISGIMAKYPLVLYLGGGVLLHTALRMIVGDEALGLGRFLVKPWDSLFTWGAGLLLLLYGYYKTVMKPGKK